jgi:hypothetical protein
VIARVLFEDDGARVLARLARLVGLVLVLDDARVLDFRTRVVEL